MPQILIAESLHETTLQKLIESGDANLYYDQHATQASSATSLDFYYNPNIDAAAIGDVIEYYDALIVRPKIISGEVIRRGKNLQLIIRGGTGVNSIDLSVASEYGVTVENTPGLNSIATAEFTFGFLFELIAKRQIVFSYVDIMESSTNEEIEAMQPEDYSGYELYGKKIAILGLGAIGQAVAARAKAFGMDVMAYSQSFIAGTVDPRVEKLDIRQAASLEELFAFGEILSLHVPLTDETHHVINKQSIQLLGDGACIINTARPQLIDPQAIQQHCAKQRLGGLAIDGDGDLIVPFVLIAKEFQEVPIMLTHHIADNTEEAQIAITQACIHQVKEFFNHNVVINQV